MKNKPEKPLSENKLEQVGQTLDSMARFAEDGRRGKYHVVYATGETEDFTAKQINEFSLAKWLLTAFKVGGQR